MAPAGRINCQSLGSSFWQYCYANAKQPGGEDADLREFFQRECCKRKVRGGPQAVAELLGDFTYVEPQELPDILERRTDLRKSAAAAETYLVRRAVAARRTVVAARNASRLRRYQSPVDVPATIWMLRMFYITQEALWYSERDDMRPAFGRWLESFEEELWDVTGGIWWGAYRNVDHCRCAENDVWYMSIGSRLREIAARMQKVDAISMTLGQKTKEGEAVWEAMTSVQCETEAGEDYQALSSIIVTSACVPGDVGRVLLALQTCLFEGQLERVLQQYEGLLPAATYAIVCHDAAYWQFDPRDVFRTQAASVWMLASFPTELQPLDPAMISRMLFRSRSHRSKLTDTRLIPSSPKCAPTALEGPFELLPEGDDRTETIELGPFCTEMGKFWLNVSTMETPAEPHFVEKLPVLAIIYATWPEWANPWHHVHWWVPALWYWRLHEGLDPADLQLGFVFAKKGCRSYERLGELVREETPECSQAGYEWPEHAPGSSFDEAFYGHGGRRLHADVLEMLSTRAAAPLKALIGQRFVRGVLGLPPLSWTTKTPAMTCSQVRSVANLVRSVPQYQAEPALPRLVPFKRRGYLLQRTQEQGRMIENEMEVLAAIAFQFPSQLDVAVLTAGDLGKMTWLQQFWTFSQADVTFGAPGAGMAWQWALPRGGVVIEMLPQSAPSFIPCSELWNDETQAGATHAGFAALVGVHHICVRTTLEPSLPVAKIKGPGWMRQQLVLSLDQTLGLLGDALNLMEGKLPRCSS
eukprot:TRINITY_DN39142_c0_g1_i1.p1 TRINITY_DN39142_c0_g1~~TRINITY_DN39142_c0_g1_i1.p1  ORF type:complete len:754 (-),score=114.72 TRINITY_DN39142_c0_g1_i1:213-2474(-)